MNEPWTGKPRRASILERGILAALALGLALFFTDYVLGGSQGASYAWFQSRQAVLAFLSWRIEAYVLVLVPVLGVGSYFLRYVLPVIEIPLLGTGEGEARWQRIWYWPGSLRLLDDEATWREGRSQAFVNKAFLARRGWMGYGVTVPVERNANPVAGEITYDTADIPAYTSRTLARRLQREVQERVVEDHKRRGGDP
jgi:hypothetical protein